MFTTIRQYRCDPAQTAEIAHRADEAFADKLAAQDGFVAYEMIDGGDGTLMTVTVFSDRQGAERSNDLAAEFVRSSLGGMQIERLSAVTGELLVNRARNDVLELVHA
jgi:hypothetical protein